MLFAHQIEILIVVSALMVGQGVRFKSPIALQIHVKIMQLVLIQWAHLIVNVKLDTLVIGVKQLLIYVS